MANVTVIGAQWGDEGKGKIVDWLASRADAVVRFQGGHNAGHTLVVAGKSVKVVIADAMSRIEATGVTQSNGWLGDEIWIRLVGPNGVSSDRLEPAVVKSAQMVEVQP